MHTDFIDQIEKSLPLYTQISGLHLHYFPFEKNIKAKPHNACADCTCGEQLYSICASMITQNKSSIFSCHKGCFHIIVPVVTTEQLHGAILSEPVSFSKIPPHNAPHPTLSADIICKTAQLFRLSLQCAIPHFSQNDKHLIALLTREISNDNPGQASALVMHCLEEMISENGLDFSALKNRSLALLFIFNELTDTHASFQTDIAEDTPFLMWIHASSISDLKQCIDLSIHRFISSVFCPYSQKHASLIHKASEYMNLHYAEHITQNHVASHVYLSPSYFSKVFKETLGISFNEYLNKVRIEKSKKLLLNPEINIEKVSSMVGYENRSYFGKIFKEYTGVTPKKYRESNKTLTRI
ncbi:MAG: AraC family transcriptional regulator [Ruminococcaceae bacterium]|nr:AraC family transcriptional regulator [Oscillospiraceae bacterium]